MIKLSENRSSYVSYRKVQKIAKMMEKNQLSIKSTKNKCLNSPKSEKNYKNRLLVQKK